jgi:hypothetical protein
MAKGVQFGRPRLAVSIWERLAVVPGRPRPAGHCYSVCLNRTRLLRRARLVARDSRLKSRGHACSLSSV